MFPRGKSTYSTMNLMHVLMGSNNMRIFPWHGLLKQETLKNMRSEFLKIIYCDFMNFMFGQIWSHKNCDQTLVLWAWFVHIWMGSAFRNQKLGDILVPSSDLWSTKIKINCVCTSLASQRKHVPNSKCIFFVFEYCWHFMIQNRSLWFSFGNHLPSLPLVAMSPSQATTIFLARKLLPAPGHQILGSFEPQKVGFYVLYPQMRTDATQIYEKNGTVTYFE